MATPIATVLSTTGQAWARDVDGNLRVLEPGDIIMEGEEIITADNGQVQLNFDDAEPISIGPGQSVAMLSDLNTDAPVPQDEATVLDDDLETLLSAIEEGEGDLFEELEAPAAGLGGGEGGGGSGFVRLARINESIDPLNFQIAGTERVDDILPEVGGGPDTATESNDAPVATDDANSGPEDTTLTGNVLDNDTDIDTDHGDLTVTEFTIGQTTYQADETAELDGVGSLIINSDGSYTFTPVENWNGQVPAINYTVSDGELSDTSTLELTVTPVNDAPVAADDANSGAEDAVLTGNVLTNDTDIDTDHGDLTVTEFTIGQTTYQADETAELGGIGSLIINSDGSYTFTPIENWNGQVPAIHYTVSDGELSDAGVLELTVTPVNDAPIANDDTNSVDIGSSNKAEGGVLDNDSDADGDPIRVIEVDGSGIQDGAGTTTINGQYGTLKIDSSGEYTYTSNLSMPILYGFNDADTQLDGNLLEGFALNSEAQRRVSILEDGVGVSGGVVDHDTPEQISETGDVLIADLGTSVSSVTFGVSHLFNDESGGESGQWFAYDANGNLVGSGVFGPDSVNYHEGSNHIGSVTITAEDVDGDFQFIAFESLDYQHGDTNTEHDGGDYLVTEIIVQDSFDYTIVDDQGGDASATLTIDSSSSLIGYQAPPDSLIIINPNDDNDVKGGYGDDIVLGDIGGTQTTVEPGNNYNISLIVDTSSSMGDPSGTSGLTRMELVKSALLNLAEQLKDHDGNINIQLVDFHSNATSATINDIDELQNLIDDLTVHQSPEWWEFWKASGGSNYEAAFNEAADWFSAQDNGYENLSFFLTDGKPTQNTSGDSGSGTETEYDDFKNAVDAFDELTSHDVTVHGIGIGDGINEDYLRFFDNTELGGEHGSVDFERIEWTWDFPPWKRITETVTGPVGEAEIVNNAEELEAVLESGSTSTDPVEVGYDTIEGGHGDDIIFGDTINTDNLPWSEDIQRPSDLPDGSGLAALKVFLELKNGKEPSNADFYDYIKEHHASLNVGGDTRGGNDVLIGGEGNDTLYGQGGEDVLNGGSGNDLLVGGVGDDTLTGGEGDDIFKWNLGDQGDDTPAHDVITDFGNGADKIDISDLLQGEDAGNIGQYVFAEEDGDDTVLYISSEGNSSNAPENADQTIRLQDKSFNDFGVASGEDLITKMIENGQLSIDQ